MPRWEIDFDYRIDMDADIYQYLARIESYRQIITHIPIPPRIARGLDELNIVRQIKGTTGLEGNPLTENQIEEIVKTVESGKKARESGMDSNDIAALEVRNAFEVQEYIKSVSSGSTTPTVTEDLIRTLHRLSTKDIPSEVNQPGEYRKRQVVAGDYMPPEASELPSLMERFTSLVNSTRLEGEYGNIIRALVAHFYLISIHPFGDGNGRVSRALEAYLLYQSRFNARGFYSLANFFYRNRERYVDELQEARFKHNGDLTSFTKFALRGFMEETDEILSRILDFVRQTMFLSYVNELYDAGKINPRCVSILTMLVKYGETLTIRHLKERQMPLLRSIYQGIRTDRTVVRDVETIRKMNLVSVERDGLIRANTAVMEQFIPS